MQLLYSDVKSTTVSLQRALDNNTIVATSWQVGDLRPLVPPVLLDALYATVHTKA